MTAPDLEAKIAANRANWNARAKLAGKTELISVDQFNGLLAKFGRNETVTLWVRRGDNQLFVTIKPAGSKQAEGADAG